MRGFLSVFILLIGVGSSRAQTAKLIPAPKPIAGCENALDVAYLPQRLTGTYEDRWLKMNIHWHKDGPPRACLIFVHGCGHSGGDKDGRGVQEKNRLPQSHVELDLAENGSWNAEREGNSALAFQIRFRT